jgi:D-serine deaminase-like pyridoxal phosphate-dependent protein
VSGTDMRANPDARARYRSAIGRRLNQLITPALVLDLDAAERNIRSMADRLRPLPAKLRPHIKVHKSPEVARMQVEAGAIGVATATVAEAIAMSSSGIADVLVANEVVGKDKIATLAQRAAHAKLTVAVDDPRNAEELSAAALSTGSEIGVLIEVDVGMGRGGTRSAEEARMLARFVADLRGLRFRGVQGYEGHCMLEPDRAARVAKARAAMEYLSSVVDLLRRDGFECEVVSAGGTGTYDITGADPRITEIQAGSYVFMDAFHGNLVPGFDPALTVLASVASHHGNTIVLDAGRKAVGVDFVPARLVGYDYEARYFAEEHTLFDVDVGCGLRLGDTVALLPGYAPTTVNLYDAYHVARDGVVVDIWPIVARGSGDLYPRT